MKIEAFTIEDENFYIERLFDSAEFSYASIDIEN